MTLQTQTIFSETPGNTSNLIIASKYMFNTFLGFLGLANHLPMHFHIIILLFQCIAYKISQKHIS